MKVVLLVDINGCGKKGDIVEVSEGYANNYLIAKGLAQKLTNKLLKEIEQDNQNREVEKQAQIEANNKDKSLLNKEYLVKRKIFNYVVEYQHIEEFLYQFLYRYHNNDEYKQYIKLRSFNEMVDPFIHLLEKIKPNCTGEYITALSNLLKSVYRNTIIHDFTEGYQKYAENNENMVEKTELLDNLANNLERELLKFLYINNRISTFYSPLLFILQGDNRPLDLNKSVRSFTHNNIEDKERVMKRIDASLSVAFYDLLSIYNQIKNNLVTIIELINKKYNVWDENEIEAIREKAIGYCYKLLAHSNSKKDILIRDALNNIDKFHGMMKKIYPERNYWVHYFAIVFLRKTGTSILEFGHKEEKLNILNEMMSSKSYAEAFNNKLLIFIKRESK